MDMTLDLKTLETARANVSKHHEIIGSQGGSGSTEQDLKNRQHMDCVEYKNKAIVSILTYLDTEIIKAKNHD